MSAEFNDSRPTVRRRVTEDELESIRDTVKATNDRLIRTPGLFDGLVKLDDSSKHYAFQDKGKAVVEFTDVVIELPLANPPRFEVTGQHDFTPDTRCVVTKLTETDLRYRAEDRRCDICGTTRKRNYVYSVEPIDGAAPFQVGATCARELALPTLFEIADLLHTLNEDPENPDDEKRRKATPEPHYLLDTALALVLRESDVGKLLLDRDGDKVVHVVRDSALFYLDEFAKPVVKRDPSVVGPPKFSESVHSLKNDIIGWYISQDDRTDLDEEADRALLNSCAVIVPKWAVTTPNGKAQKRVRRKQVELLVTAVRDFLQLKRRLRDDLFRAASSGHFVSAVTGADDDFKAHCTFVSSRPTSVGGYRLTFVNDGGNRVTVFTPVDVSLRPRKLYRISGRSTFEKSPYRGAIGLEIKKYAVIKDPHDRAVAFSSGQ